MSQQTTDQIISRVLALAVPAPADPALDSIETPSAVVDLSVMAGNLVRTAQYCQQHNLAYRPHTKTHKSPVIGSAQLEAGARGLTVATLREAEVMADVCDDLLLAYPPVGGAKLTRLAQLAQRVGRVTVALDSPEVLAGVAAAARDAAVEIGVVIELDAGMGRVGVQLPMMRCVSLVRSPTPRSCATKAYCSIRVTFARRRGTRMRCFAH